MPCLAVGFLAKLPKLVYWLFASYLIACGLLSVFPQVFWPRHSGSTGHYAKKQCEQLNRSLGPDYAAWWQRQFSPAEAAQHGMRDRIWVERLRRHESLCKGSASQQMVHRLLIDFYRNAPHRRVVRDSFVENLRQIDSSNSSRSVRPGLGALGVHQRAGLESLARCSAAFTRNAIE